jgi:uncharacterized protein (TIGR02679 family)
MTDDLFRLRRLLGGPELAWLVERVRGRLETGRPLNGRVSRPQAAEAERVAVARLLGRPPRAGRSLCVSLDAVDRVLRDSGAAPGGLAAAVIALTGPVLPRRAAADALERAWHQAFAPLVTVAAADPRLACWLSALQDGGLARRVCRTPGEAVPVLAALARLVIRLPATPPRALGLFAAEFAGDAHALDQGPLATLTLDAVRAITGFPLGTGARWRRDTWASAGLLLDELSSQVLVLNLPGDTRTPTGRALDALATAGQPAVLTLRQLLRDPPCPPPGGSAFVCENPAVVVAAADRLGADCAPLVCLQGQPSTAAMRLLALCAGAGWTLRYHGDFDWGGVRIAARVRADVLWSPWRFTAADYSAALAAHPATPALSGSPADTPWDPALAPALRHAGRRIEEELVLDHLLADLSG